MKHIICGTNRPNSRSFEISKIVQKLYLSAEGVAPEIINLVDIDLNELTNHHYGELEKPIKIKQAVTTVNSSDGLIFVVPEYNGSYPGALKYFIDHWKFPDSFESRPVCFIGLGGRFGALRSIEHLQGIMGHRSAYMFPERIFISNVWDILADGKINDKVVTQLLEQQTNGFIKFVRALKTEALDANSLLKERP